MFLIRYLVKCSKCGAEAMIGTFSAADEASRGFLPTLPPGWAEGQRTQFFCPKHRVVVTITVDGISA